MRFGEICVLRPTQGTLGVLAHGHIVVGLERPEGSPRLVALQRPAACDRNFRSVAFDVEQLAFPAAVAQERCGDLLKRRGKDCLQQLMRDPADRLFALPTI